jgi:hypothetical protein
MSRSLDDLVTTTEHAEPLHPVRNLFRHHFYLDDFVNSEGGLWLVMLNALLLVPLAMAAFFWPMGVLAVVGAALLVAFAGYEGYVLWRRHRLRT